MLFGFENPAFYLVVSVLLPILGGFGVLLLNKKENIRDVFVLINALLTLALTTFIFINKSEIFASIIYITLPFSNKVFVVFSLEKYGLTFAMLASFLWVVTSLYSIGYMRGHKEKNQTRFYFFFAISISFTLGVAYSGSLLSMFLFYELLTVATYPLVTHNGNEEAKKSGRVYLGILMGASIAFLLPAILISSYVFQEINYMPLAKPINLAGVSPLLVFVLILMFAYGLAKAALMPLHRWLPAAMVAPTPVSSLLHAVAVVKSGVFILVKVFGFYFGAENIAMYFTSLSLNLNSVLAYLASNLLLLIACFTVVASSFIAMKQDNIKKMLAYSTISQLSYIVMTMAMFSSASALASTIHIVAHAFSKITLFFVAGAIAVTAHKKYISEISGIAKRMPLTITAFLIASMSLVGIPGTIGFVSKFAILQVAIAESKYIVIATLLVSTVLNTLYLLKFAFIAFFKEEDEKYYYNHKEASLSMLIPICITASLVVLLFFDYAFRIFLFKHIF